MQAPSNEPEFEPDSRHPRLAAWAGIGAITLTLASAFAWTAGWIGTERLTAPRMIEAIEANGPAHPGFRRAHAKGVCVTGVFRSSGAAAALSSARVFTQPETPVLGRLSIGGGDPYGADAKARVRSMALLLRTDDGQEWRTAMNSFAFFAVATAEAFQALTLASRPEAVTGKPDPAKMAALLERYPEVRKFQSWASTAPWSDSWGNTRYNGVNAFRLIAEDGSVRHVRWSMLPRLGFVSLNAQERERADADFLSRDLAARLAQAPLQWDLVLTLAERGDPVDDASQPWPENRTQIVAGTLTLTHAEPQATGACRDINFDPLILPTGIRGSDDPILATRSAVYSQSFNRRERELGRAAAAVDQGTPR